MADRSWGAGGERRTPMAKKPRPRSGSLTITATVTAGPKRGEATVTIDGTALAEIDAKTAQLCEDALEFWWTRAMADEYRELQTVREMFCPAISSAIQNAMASLPDAEPALPENPDHVGGDPTSDERNAFDE